MGSIESTQAQHHRLALQASAGEPDWFRHLVKGCTCCVLSHLDVFGLTCVDSCGLSLLLRMSFFLLLKNV